MGDVLRGRGTFESEYGSTLRGMGWHFPAVQDPARAVSRNGLFTLSAANPRTGERHLRYTHYASSGGARIHLRVPRPTLPNAITCPPAPVAGAATAGGSVPVGFATTFKISYADANGYETEASAESNAITCVSGYQTVPLTIAVSTNSRTTARKIYMNSAAGPTTWKLVATVSDNTTTTVNVTAASGTTPCKAYNFTAYARMTLHGWMVQSSNNVFTLKPTLCVGAVAPEDNSSHNYANTLSPYRTMTRPSMAPTASQDAGAGSVNVGIHWYKIVFYGTYCGYTLACNPFSATLSDSAHRVHLAGLTEIPQARGAGVPGSTMVGLFRTLAGSPEEGPYFYVKDLTGGVADQYDNASDASIQGNQVLVDEDMTGCTPYGATTSMIDVRTPSGYSAVPNGTSYAELTWVFDFGLFDANGRPLTINCGSVDADSPAVLDGLMEYLVLRIEITGNTPNKTLDLDDWTLEWADFDATKQMGPNLLEESRLATPLVGEAAEVTALTWAAVQGYGWRLVHGGSADLNCDVLGPADGVSGDTYGMCCKNFGMLYYPRVGQTPSPTAAARYYVRRIPVAWGRYSSLLFHCLMQTTAPGVYFRLKDLDGNVVAQTDQTGLAGNNWVQYLVAFSPPEDGWNFPGGAAELWVGQDDSTYNTLRMAYPSFRETDYQPEEGGGGEDGGGSDIAWPSSIRLNALAYNVDTGGWVFRQSLGGSALAYDREHGDLFVAGDGFFGQYGPRGLAEVNGEITIPFAFDNTHHFNRLVHVECLISGDPTEFTCEFQVDGAVIGAGEYTRALAVRSGKEWLYGDLGDDDVALFSEDGSGGTFTEPQLKVVRFPAPRGSRGRLDRVTIRASTLGRFAVHEIVVNHTEGWR